MTYHSSDHPTGSANIVEPNRVDIDTIICNALAEDIGEGDVTTLNTIPAAAQVTGRFLLKAEGVVAGLQVAEKVFRQLDPRVEFEALVAEGTQVGWGDVVAVVRGSGRAILTGERTALNLMQRMSGIATQTRCFVDAVAGTKAVILDTRKTVPGLRALDKWAVRLGGGQNHRFGLYDMAMIKDNHIAAVGGLSEAVERIRASGADVPIEVEVTDLVQLREALSLPVDRIMLDNMSLDAMREAVAVTAGRIPLEASGNVSLETVAAIAATGVDYISSGALTHSVTALDISLDLEPISHGGRMSTSASNQTQLSVEEIYEDMKAHLSDIVPDPELRIKAELAHEINQLKVERNAVILGHNYMEAALFHSIPDFKGDSLQLSRMAAEVDADVIVFCGVEFMAETAKILNPEKTVLIPSDKAGCSLAESITAADVRELKRRFPGVPVVTYVNTYADVKAESDVCCTSGNAKAVMESFDSDTIIFLPDEYLAGNIAAETGKRIIVPKVLPGGDVRYDTAGEYDVIGWHGRCEVHEQFTVEDVANVRAQFPDVAVLSHPECSPEVVAVSDYSGSTSGMIRFVQESNAARYLVLTECAMGDNIAAENPDKDMLRLCMVRCPHMNQITLEDTRDALKFMRYQVEVPEDIRVRALSAVERMLAIG